MVNNISPNRTLSISDIELIVYDFDGVMTDNTALIDEEGHEYVRVNRSDGLAVSLIKKAGISQLILSTESNKTVLRRAEKLKLPVLNNIVNKKETISQYCSENKLDITKVLYVGNDINDLEAMQLVGFSFCPADASDEVKAVSQTVLSKKGGEGVIRELLNYLNI